MTTNKDRDTDTKSPAAKALVVVEYTAMSSQALANPPKRIAKETGGGPCDTRKLLALETQAIANEGSEVEVENGPRQTKDRGEEEQRVPSDGALGLGHEFLGSQGQLEVPVSSESLVALCEDLQVEDLQLKTALKSIQEHSQKHARLMSQLSSQIGRHQNSKQHHDHLQQQKGDELEHKVRYLELQLSCTREELEQANRTIRSQGSRLKDQESLKGFKELVRFRCFHTYRKTKLKRTLKGEEQSRIQEANDEVHGGDCLFDMLQIMQTPSDASFPDYAALYGIDPRELAKHRYNKRLLGVTNMIGHVTLNEMLSAGDVQEFRNIGKNLQSSLVQPKRDVPIEEYQSESLDASTTEHSWALRLDFDNRYDQLLNKAKVLRALRASRAKATRLRSQQAQSTPQRPETRVPAAATPVTAARPRCPNSMQALATSSGEAADDVIANPRVAQQ